VEQCKHEYFAEVNAVSSEQGFWNDVTMFFVIAYKSHTPTLCEISS
jgi:hypothetical protein